MGFFEQISTIYISEIEVVITAKLNAGILKMGLG